jgi:hypothetical protein
MSSILITRPKHDGATRYLFYWAEKIIGLAKQKGIKILDLKEKRANKKEFVSIMSKMKPLLIFLNGHGADDRVNGHNDEILIKAGENEDLLKNKIVYTLSCRSGNDLGPKSINAGTLSYVGYNDDFVFIWDEDKLTRPLEDKTAELFLGPSNYVVESLLKGHTVDESYKRSQKLFIDNIQKVLTSESSYLAPYLLWDARHQVCLGDGASKL